SQAGEVFIEAESFKSFGGWEVASGPVAKSASGLAMLNGAGGKADGIATTTVSIKDAGHYRIWVRYTSHPKWRGPFHVTALSGSREVGDALFDSAFESKSTRDTETWGSFEAELPEGEITLRLSKHENKNCSGTARNVDCLLLTMDDKLVPNHLQYGAQTFVRVTMGDCYEKPAYIHIFADHFRAPWSQHYSLARAGAVAGIAPKKTDLLKSGESTPWCNITPMIYQDSGAMLTVTARHSYAEQAERMRATFEFATAPDERSVVRTIRMDFKPSGTAIFLPPNLLTQENIALLKTAHEIADENGKLADAHTWPTHGRKPERFPLFVTASMGSVQFARDAALTAREQKTLDYFGFTDEHLRRISGAWFAKDGSYCNPDIEKMRAKIGHAAAEFKSGGGDVKKIVFAELMDEPTGQPLEFAATDPAYAEHFRAWLKAMGKSPADLLVKDWDAVKIITGEQRDEFPALHYFSQRFRTRALGDFMAVQRSLAEQAYGGTFPVLVNFSDGAVYAGNFYNQGVDYFELLDAPDQNAIWGEDWSNGASTYQCASYNVDLMRAAARERGQMIGHHLIAHAGRKAWDIKLKATSELARGVKVFNNFCYGPTWATHEGGPYWRTHVWQGKPETWTANAAINREVGAVEDMLLTAMPAPAKVALLYSSASDVWTVGGNLAYGFDRMHTWLALAHAQVPVDVVSEQQVAKGMLTDYSVCYLTGPNLTIAATEKLRRWVQAGGTLWLTAGAASRDEFNRPLHVLDDLLPATRGDVADLQQHASSGRYLALLTAKDEVRWDGGSAAVLSVKQPLTARASTTTLATFKDNSPAVVRGSAGKGTVYCTGFLPSLAYIKQALDARNSLLKKVTDGAVLSPDEMKDAALLERTANPWKFPGDIREFILAPVRSANLAKP
ncbi:MAG: beta-galactosidase trimerization domain-containing protein, partial [Chthoniobacteraceae bacterium]